MLMPRAQPDNLGRADLTFIGGTQDFDLWIRDKDVTSSDYPLRVFRVANGDWNWDIFKLPLHDNKEVGSDLHPEDRGVTGYWDDVNLSREDMDQIETYLKCFAPWVLGEDLTC